MYKFFFKSLFDKTVALVLLVASLPFLMLATFLNFIDGHQNPFFIQKRLGKNSKEFTILKFRTMHYSHEGSKPVHVKPGAKELTPIGRFLRATSIDEMPQLLNVLKGDMSLIGPRPHALEYASYYASIDPKYYERYAVRPGLACIVEATRLHYLTESEAHIKCRIKCDLYYARRQSFILDAKIFYKIALTVFKSFLPKPKPVFKPQSAATEYTPIV